MINHTNGWIGGGMWIWTVIGAVVLVLLVVIIIQNFKGLRIFIFSVICSFKMMLKKEEKCIAGIKSLENYKKGWNDRYEYWSSIPLHNFASYEADAFRMMSAKIE